MSAAQCTHEAGQSESEVIDSRPRGTVIRRVRKCRLCGDRFETFESTNKQRLRSNPAPTNRRKAQ